MYCAGFNFGNPPQLPAKACPDPGVLGLLIMTGEPNISFVTATVQLQSRHDVELQHAAVRSHNARLAAARRKTRTRSIPLCSRHLGSNPNSEPKKSQSSHSQPQTKPRSRDDAAAVRKCDHPAEIEDIHALVVRPLSSKKNVWTPSPWHWSKGTRVDDFACIPGSNFDIAPGSIDFRELYLFALSRSALTLCK